MNFLALLVLLMSPVVFANSNLYYSYPNTRLFIDPISTVDEIVTKDGGTAVQVNAVHSENDFSEFPFVKVNRKEISCKIASAELQKLSYTTRQVADMILAGQIDLACLNIDHEGTPDIFKFSLKVDK
jgi:hypothetical protein